MIDAQQIGAVSGWIAGSAQAQVYRTEVSSHLFQEASAHLLPVSPTGAWLEYMNVADPILTEPLRPVDGMVSASARSGIGRVWDHKAVHTYRVA